METLQIIIAVIVISLLLWGLEILFYHLFSSKPPKDSIEYLYKLVSRVDTYKKWWQFWK